MAVRIRLRRMGRKKKPHYRVVVTDKASPRDGRFVETLGHYRPLTTPARLILDLERVDYWIEQGAVPSDTVHSLISKARRGGDDDLAVGEVDRAEEKARQAEEITAKRKAEAEMAKADAAAKAEPLEAESEVTETAKKETGPVDVAPETTASEELAEEAEQIAGKGDTEGATKAADAAVEAEAVEEESAEDEGEKQGG